MPSPAKLFRTGDLVLPVIEENVEKIMSRKSDGRGWWLYEVLWKTGDITWEPAHNLANCKTLLRKFLQTGKAETTKKGSGRDVLKLRLQKRSGGNVWEKTLTETAHTGSAYGGTDETDFISRRHNSHATQISPHHPNMMSPTTSQSNLRNTAKMNKDGRSITKQKLLPSNNSKDTESATTSTTIPPVDTETHSSNGCAEDFVVSPDPRNWTYSQVIGDLCRNDERLVVSDLRPLKREKVAGDVLLKCSISVLRDDLGLSFNTAVRVTNQIGRLKKIVKGLEEIVIDDSKEVNGPEKDLVERIKFKVKSPHKIKKVNVEMKATVKVGKLADGLSLMLEVPMDKVELRCNGRLLRNDEEVRGLDDQTVCVTVKVKGEEL
eukprot:GFUD01042463.1.p1 GENE.GFUD01042463.1~~GFUD01042463.1.p1  ORF type:complete len:377 (-),score=91.07 GFUD01042463.1:271-1401(-)